MQGTLRRPKNDLRGVDLANRFDAMRRSLELTKRAKISGSLLVTAVAAVLGYGYLGPTLSDLISSTTFILLAAVSNPFFVAVRLVMGVNSIVNGYSVASSAAGIQLDTFPSAAAQTVVALFSLVGLSHLIIGLLGALVVIRYRGAIPFMFALILLDHGSGELILQAVPIAANGTPPGGAINVALFVIEITGFALSLRSGGFVRRRTA